MLSSVAHSSYLITLIESVSSIRISSLLKPPLLRISVRVPDWCEYLCSWTMKTLRLKQLQYTYAKISKFSRQNMVSCWRRHFNNVCIFLTFLNSFKWGIFNNLHISLHHMWKLDPPKPWIDEIWVPNKWLQLLLFFDGSNWRVIGQENAWTWRENLIVMT